LEITTEGFAIFGKVTDNFKCRYHSGPLFKHTTFPTIPAYTIATYFRSEVSDNETEVGIMLNTPAAIFSSYGKGNVFLVSSHPENTPGLENFLPSVIVWLTDKTLHFNN
jgi:hypothetical protein